MWIVYTVYYSLCACVFYRTHTHSQADEKRSEKKCEGIYDSAFSTAYKT